MGHFIKRRRSAERPIVPAFFQFWVMVSFLGFWLGRLMLSTQFFTDQYGPNNLNSYLGAYVSILSPPESILK